MLRCSKLIGFKCLFQFQARSDVVIRDNAFYCVVKVRARKLRAKT